MKPWILALALLFPAAAFAAEGHPTLPASQVETGGDSLYVLDGKLTDQDGKEVTLEKFRGKPVLISMFYATCPHACPMLVSDIRKIDTRLDPAIREELQVVLVTFDPDRDSPEVLRNLRAAHEVDKDRWTFLRADHGFVRELAAVLGIRYRFTPDGSIGHSSVITLLDRDGAIAARVEGVRQPADDIVRKLNAMKK
ncbi:MAG TPA: SCO family protein [Vulgatibacter sp.]|nr:SCO family protein [Vulgatibacter sp.]